MLRAILRFFTFLAALGGIAVGSYVCWMSQQALAGLRPTFVEPAKPVAGFVDPKAAHDGHVATPAEPGAHDAPAPAGQPKSKVPATMVSLEELFVNVPGPDDSEYHVGMKIDLELFEDTQRMLLDRRLAGVRDAIIRTAREQDSGFLGSTPGKLFFKESIVQRINQFLGAPIVRDAHFASFQIQ